MFDYNSSTIVRQQVDRPRAYETITVAKTYFDYPS
jgi:hypothetical protein